MQNLLKKMLVLLFVICLMMGTITGIMTYVNLPQSELFFNYWLTSFATAVIVILPISYLIMMLVNRLIKLFYSHKSKLKQNVMFGFGMAIIMEAVMAVSTTLNNIGWIDTSTFLKTWLISYLAALPFGILISLIMSLFLKPRIEKFLANS